MTPRLEPRIARQAEVDTQCRHCSGGGACLLSGHQLPNHESPSLTSSTGGEAIDPMEVSLFPAWAGNKQPRLAHLERNTLRLSTEGPVQSGGQKVMMFLVWQRAPLNN